MDLIYMKETFCLILIFLVYTQESAIYLGRDADGLTECDATGDTILKCKFPENISTTQTGFAVYFDSIDDSAELLVDCGWIHQHLECIEQEGFKCNQPVSDTAIINVPYRYTNRSGTYRCTPESSNNKDIKSCSCSESQLGQQSEAQVKKEKEKQEDTTQKNLDTNHSVPIEWIIIATLISFVAGGALGFFTPLLLCVLYKKFFKKNRQNSNSKRLRLDRALNKEEYSCSIMEMKAIEVEVIKAMSDNSATSSQPMDSLEKKSSLLNKVVDNDRLRFVSEKEILVGAL